MSTIAMIPHNTGSEIITISSKAFSMLLLSLSAYGVILENGCECGESDSVPSTCPAALSGV